MGLPIQGTWYDPSTSGQGIQIDYIRSTSGDVITMAWYTYDPSPEGLLPNGLRRQMWMIAQGTVIDGRRAALTIYTTLDGQFNLPSSRLITLGTAQLEVLDCSTMVYNYDFQYQGADRLTGQIVLQRLTAPLAVNGVNICTGATQTTQFERTTGIQSGHTGAYYVPALSGQGVLLEYIDRSSINQPPDLALAMYTYDPTAVGPTNRKYWFIALGSFVLGSSESTMTVYRTQGGLFDMPNPPGLPIVNEPIGQMRVLVNGCGSLRLDYSPFANSELPAFSQDLTRLSPIDTYQGQPLCR